MANPGEPTARTALLVVDVQKDFCPGGALPAPGCTRILPAVNRAVAEARARGFPVYASRDWHPEVTTHFKEFGGEWPPHCMHGTPGADFHPELNLPGDVVVISKGDQPDHPGYSAFDGHTANGTPLATDLRDRKIEVLWVAGIATEYCVKHTVLDALRAGFTVRVLTDAVTAIDVHPGDGQAALEEMSVAGAEMSPG